MILLNRADARERSHRQRGGGIFEGGATRRLVMLNWCTAVANLMIRVATFADIPRLVEIRGAVRENRLSNPNSVTLADYEWHIAHAPIHVWEDDGVIKGLSAGDPRTGNIWALFVDPTHEGHGIGQALIQAACRSLAAVGHRVAMLSTDPGTRAERFYLRNGWLATNGYTERGEVIFTKQL